MIIRDGKLLNCTRCPLCGEPVDDSAVLDIAKPLARWSVYCQAGAWLHITGNDDKSRVIYMTGATKPPEPHKWNYVDNQNVIYRDEF